MKETDSKKQKEAEFMRQHTISPKDFERMIKEKMERAQAYTEACRKRETVFQDYR